MKYAIVYSSKTGNTKLLATTILNQRKEDDCVYIGEPSPKALLADIIYIGFWTDKGTCQEEIKAFLHELQQQKIFLFGTAGFGGDQSYFDRILASVKKEVPEGVEIVGSFMCQGKMPMAVRQRYEGMLSQNERMQAMIDNFDLALSHPDEKDVETLIQEVQKTL